MQNQKINDNTWISIKSMKKKPHIPSEIRICFNGRVFIDGEPYNEENSPYPNLTVDIESHNRLSTGEETQKIIESRKTAKKGEKITIRDIKEPDRTESTTVKF